MQTIGASSDPSVSTSADKKRHSLSDRNIKSKYLFFNYIFDRFDFPKLREFGKIAVFMNLLSLIITLRPLQNFPFCFDR